MKFKIKALIILIGHIGSSFAMNDESYSTPTKKLKRTCVDSSKFYNEFIELKSKFKEAVGCSDYGSAKLFLNDIENISFQPSLVLASPKIKHVISKFLNSSEVEQFKKDYFEYKNKLKEELNNVLVGKNSQQILPKELSGIVYEYIC